MPADRAIAEIPYDEWDEFVWHNPLFTGEGSFVAMIDGVAAAVSLLLADFEWGRAVNMFTGTRRAATAVAGLRSPSSSRRSAGRPRTASR